MRYITEDDANDQYDQMLDDCYPIVTIGSLTYYPSRVLKTVDPIAYRCGLTNWLDSENLTTDESEADETDEDEEEVTEEDVKEALGDSITLEMHMTDGFTLSAIIDGEYQKKRYMGYTVPEACAMFRIEFNAYGEGAE